MNIAMKFQYRMRKSSIACWLLHSSSCSAFLSRQSSLQCSSHSAGYRSIASMNIGEVVRSSALQADKKTIDGGTETYQPEPDQKGRMRVRRPHNSYLKILADDAVFEELHSLTQQLKASWEAEHCTDSIDMEFQALSEVISDVAFQPSIDGPTAESEQTDANNSRPRFKIKTRSLQSLHMTYFFCGTMLNEMPADQLTLLNVMLHERLNNIDNRDGSYWIKFKSIDLFPPQRQNLIAAKFESSPALDELYEELCDIAMTPKSDNGKNDNEDNTDKHPFTLAQKEYEFPLLRSNVFKQVKKRRQQQKRNKNTASPWVAHVTLANIVGGKKSGIKQFGEWLSEQQFGATGRLSDEEHTIVKGFTLGGPYPEHVDLDWNYPFDLRP